MIVPSTGRGIGGIGRSNMAACGVKVPPATVCGEEGEPQGGAGGAVCRLGMNVVIVIRMVGVVVGGCGGITRAAGITGGTETVVIVVVVVVLVLLLVVIVGNGCMIVVVVVVGGDGCTVAVGGGCGCSCCGEDINRRRSICRQFRERAHCWGRIPGEESTPG